MRRALLLGAALAALAGGAQAMTHGQRLVVLGSGKGAVVVPIGAVKSVQVLANGWEAQVKLKGLICAGTFGAYALTPDATPKGVLTVTSPGYTTTGAATTIARTVEFTVPVRQPVSNNALPSETQSGADCIIPLALSDFVNVNDTATLSLTTGAYTSGIANITQTGVVVTNSSAVAHPKPICNWITPPHQSVTSSQAFTAEVVCFHARAQGGKEVQAVKFDASDGTNHATAIASSMTQLSAIDTTGNPIYGYSATFAAGAFAGLTSGACAAGASCQISLDFIAYPIVGDQVTQASAGQDGVAIASTVRTPNLKPLDLVWDQAGKYTPVFGWVNSTGTCTGAGCISSSSTDPGTGAAANYASWEKCAAGGQAYNAANRGHNDTAGVVCEVRAGTWNGFDPSLDLNSTTPGKTWLTFKAAPGHGVSDVIYMPASTATGGTGVNDRVWIDSIALTQASNAFANFNRIMVGNDGANNNPVASEILLNNAKVTSVAGNLGLFYETGLVRFYNTTIVDPADGVICRAAGANQMATTIIGGSYDASPPSDAVSCWVYLIAGLQSLGLTITSPLVTASTYVVSTGPIIYASMFYKTDDPFDIRPSGVNWPSANFADVENIWEKVTNDNLPVHIYLSDGDETPFSNYVEQLDTYVGDRENLMYNDGEGASGGAKSTPKSGFRQYVVVDPVAGQGFNMKGDPYTGTNGANGARVGNWPVTFGVGFRGDVEYQSANSQTAPSLDGTSWLGEYCGLGSGCGLQVAWTSNKSLSGSNTGSALGNVTNYVPTGGSGSPAYGRIPAGLAPLPKDLAGVAIPNDGTGCAGALQGC
jgi:hypothetical protein